MKTILHIAPLLALILACAAPRLAFAHAYLDHAEPKVGAQLDTPPAEIKIWFTDDIDPTQTTIQVLNSDGTQVDKKDLHLDPKDKTLALLSLPLLPPGKYKVVWHAVCTCGHKTQGDFTFSIKPDAAGK